MSDVLQCGRVLEMLPQWADGELSADEESWLNGHVGECSECAATLAEFTALDGQLTGWGQLMARRNLPSREARERLVARLMPPAHVWNIRWMPAGAAALAVAIVLAAIVPPRPAAIMKREETPMVAIPYLPPLDPRENATIVRMNLRVGTLLAMGYKMSADPDRVVPAEVLVGEDGRAHAVRLVGSSN